MVLIGLERLRPRASASLGLAVKCQSSLQDSIYSFKNETSRLERLATLEEQEALLYTVKYLDNRERGAARRHFRPQEPQVPGPGS